MSAPATRRLSLLAANCAYCARHSSRVAPARWRKWPNSLHSSSRRWYADETPAKPKQASRRTKEENNEATAPEDVSKATSVTAQERATPVVESQKADGEETSTIEAVSSSADQSAAEPGQLDSQGGFRSNPLQGDVDDDIAAPSSETKTSPQGTSAEIDPALERTTRSSEPDTGLPEGAILESEQVEEEEELEDIIGITEEASQEAAIRAAMGVEGEERAVAETGDERGFWNYAAIGPRDEAYLRDNVTSLGHDELEQQREYREYARLAAWELPLLSKLAKPFTAPTKQQPLRFRYTSYLGEEHPAASKVVLEFAPSDIPDLTEVQRNKLIKLLGPRYNPSTHTAKMSHESQDSQAQNKRWLLDRFGDLLAAARDPSDTFEDVPFDFRHHKPKKWHEFPKSWIVSEERVQQLIEQRRVQAQLEDKREEIGSVVDGKKILQKVMIEPPKEPQRVIVNSRTGERVMPRRRM